MYDLSPLCYNQITMRDAIVSYIITLNDRRNVYREQRAMATNRADYDVANELYGSITALDDIVADLREFVKSGGYEDLMKQALTEAYGPPPENAGDAMAEAARAAGLKDVRVAPVVTEEEWYDGYKKWKEGR